MKLKIIGNNGVFPAKGGACSSYLIETADYKILIDMGPGSLARLQEVCPIDQIDIYIFSHLHYDHVSDFFSLKYALQLMKARGQYAKKPMLILPKTPENMVDILTDNDLLDVHYSIDNLTLRLKNTKIEFAGMTHPVESYAVKVSEKEKSIVYSGDTNRVERIAKFAAGADIFLSDAGLLEKHKSETAPHMSIAEACEAGADAKKTLLVHLSPLYTEAEIKREVKGNAEISALGAEYEL